VEIQVTPWGCPTLETTNLMFYLSQQPEDLFLIVMGEIRKGAIVPGAVVAQVKGEVLVEVLPEFPRIGDQVGD